MIAERRSRRRALMRGTAMTSLLARNLTSVGDLIKRRQNQKSQGFAGQEEKTVPSLSAYASISSFSESMLYLHHLTALHKAGILTDDEYTAAQQRILGS